MKSKLKKQLTAGLATLIVIGGGVWVWASRPPKPTDDPAKVMKYVASDAFAKLPTAEKEKYAHEMFQNRRTDRGHAMETLSVEETAKAMFNLQSTRPNPMSDYFALPQGPQRTAYLDKMIDQGEKFRAERAARAATRPAVNPANAQANGGRGGRWDAGKRDQMRKAMDDLVSPTQRAQMAEFRAAMAKRRAERGLPAHGGWGR
jgi:hypothetical protein